MQPTIDSEIRRTIAAYCHTVDDGRFDDFAELWAPDAVLRVLGDEVRGRDAITEWMARAQPPEKRGRHLTLNPLIAVAAADRATATSDFVFLGRVDGGWRITVVGRYLDEFVPIDGRWRFASRTIVM